MIKVAMIGAGSVVFSKNLTGDILSYPEFKDATFTYMDIDQDRLEVGAGLCRKVAKALGATPTIEATLDRRKALDGADFVINMVQIGGFDSTLVDFEIPRKYGLKFTIADTTGPGGLFRALRTFPMLSGLVRDMEDVCPDAILLNYSNPMSMNMQTITRTSGIQAVGLCHSVQGTLNQIMRDISVDPEEVAFICAGINHMAFYLSLKHNGQDLYPRLFEASKETRIFNSNKVRYELMRRLGYFITESSEHNAEYSAHFMTHGPELIERFSVPIDEYLRRCDGIVDEFERMKTFAQNDEPIEVHRSHEYGSTIIHSVVTGKPSVVYGNMPNNGAISNLPNSAIAEAPTLVDRAGLQLTTVGDLPPQLVGYMQPHVTQHELFIRAALEGRRDHVYQAAMFDPLTAATMPLDKIVEMCDELIAAHGNLLPKLDAPMLIPTSGNQYNEVDPKDLRASWDNAQKEASADYIQEWQAIGPFPVEADETATLLLGDGGTVDVSAGYQNGAGELSWQTATANKTGWVALNHLTGSEDLATTFAYAEVESIHPRETVIRCDPGVDVWLNGKLVHDGGNDECGGVNGQAAVHLKEGVNGILVKVPHKAGGGSFSLAVPKANF